MKRWIEPRVSDFGAKTTKHHQLSQTSMHTKDNKCMYLRYKIIFFGHVQYREKPQLAKVVTSSDVRQITENGQNGFI